MFKISPAHHVGKGVPTSLSSSSETCRRHGSHPQAKCCVEMLASKKTTVCQIRGICNTRLRTFFSEQNLQCACLRTTRIQVNWLTICCPVPHTASSAEKQTSGEVCVPLYRRQKIAISPFPDLSLVVGSCVSMWNYLLPTAEKPNNLSPTFQETYGKQRKIYSHTYH
uniref:Uncharacterized protein n=1 Tax=Octopus bimaculoides TaxID=37653 RepID=A0A0L8IA56_OCTBM